MRYLNLHVYVHVERTILGPCVALPSVSGGAPLPRRQRPPFPTPRPRCRRSRPPEARAATRMATARPISSSHLFPCGWRPWRNGRRRLAPATHRRTGAPIARSGGPMARSSGAQGGVFRRHEGGGGWAPRALATACARRWSTWAKPRMSHPSFQRCIRPAPRRRPRLRQCCVPRHGRRALVAAPRRGDSGGGSGSGTLAA